MKHINEEDDYSKYYLKKIFTSGMGTLIFSQMTQIMKEPRYQLWPILVCKAKNPNISIIKITIQWWNDLETVNITNLSLVFFFIGSIGSAPCKIMTIKFFEVLATEYWNVLSVVSLK